MKVLQINLTRGAAHSLAYATGRQKDIDLLILSEPNVNKVKSRKWIKSENVDVTVFCVDRQLQVLSAK